MPALFDGAADSELVLGGRQALKGEGDLVSFEALNSSVSCLGLVVVSDANVVSSLCVVNFDDRRTQALGVI